MTEEQLQKLEAKLRGLVEAGLERGLCLRRYWERPRASEIGGAYRDELGTCCLAGICLPGDAPSRKSSKGSTIEVVAKLLQISVHDAESLERGFEGCAAFGFRDRQLADLGRRIYEDYCQTEETL